MTGTPALVDSLPPMEVAARLPRLVAALEPAGCDALLVSSLENIRYLTGFSGSAALLLVRGAGVLLCTDGRYRDQARLELEAAGVDAEVHVGLAASQLEAVRHGLGPARRLGVEAAAVSWAEVRRLQSILEGIVLVPTAGLVETLRMVKDEGEVARIEAACAIADVALAQTKEMLLSGCSEVAFSAELDHEMLRRGASAPSFATIVASGPNAALPHARPSGRIVGRGELVVVDFGATVDGYHSDMTRTLCVGEPADGLDAVVEAVLAAQRAGVRAVVAGTAAAAVDAACRESLEAAGYLEAFTHSTGHGVGLEIHEAPRLAAESADILPADSVVTVEPGVYLPGRGGARIEDTVVLTDRGARLLTKSTKDYTL